jgi:hypothetical protein
LPKQRLDNDITIENLAIRTPTAICVFGYISRAPYRLMRYVDA